MLSARRSLLQNFTSAPELPRVPALDNLYRWGLKVRKGSVTMIAGRPGSMKSALTLFWVRQMGLQTLYFSADMTPFEASTRLAAVEMGISTDLVAQKPIEEVAAALRGSNLQFSFESPISWYQIKEELEAFVEVSNSYPEVVVLDNLMDFEGGESDYAAQMSTMQNIVAMARDTEAALFVLHHTTTNTPLPSSMPQPGKEIKNKLGEKPQQVITVALDPQPRPSDGSQTMRLAVVKQRSGKMDADADPKNYISLRVDPVSLRFWSE